MEYRTIGYVAGTHGLKGEIRVKPQTHFVEERFAKGATVYLEHDAHMHAYTVETVREHKGMILIQFKEVHDINEVEGWRSDRLCIHEDQIQPLDEDEIYYHDLMQMQVEDEDGHVLGKVTEILETGAHVVIRVVGEQTCLIPYTAPFIVSADVKEKRLVVNLIEGMI